MGVWVDKFGTQLSIVEILENELFMIFHFYGISIKYTRENLDSMFCEVDKDRAFIQQCAKYSTYFALGVVTLVLRLSTLYIASNSPVTDSSGMQSSYIQPEYKNPSWSLWL